jgi:nitroreductase
MKNLIIFSLFALFISGIAFSQDNETIKTIKSRKSVRHFTGDAVSKEDLKKLLEAGMSAPTAVNKQPWSFVAVTDRKTLDALADKLPSAKMLFQAGAAIIICAIPEKAYDKIKEFAVIDCSLAGENILLSAESLGLGALWTASYPDPARMSTVREILNIPDDIIPLCVIPIGKPTGEDKPKEKFDESNIHWDKW